MRTAGVHVKCTKHSHFFFSVKSLNLAARIPKFVTITAIRRKLHYYMACCNTPLRCTDVKRGRERVPW